jgi:hypothetical protein
MCAQPYRARKIGELIADIEWDETEQDRYEALSEMKLRHSFSALGGLFGGNAANSSDE